MDAGHDSSDVTSALWQSCATIGGDDSCAVLDYPAMRRLSSPQPPIQGNSKVPSGNGRSARVASVSSLTVFGSETAAAVILSAVAGYVDTAGFLALFGLFTAHITGDLVTAGTSMAGNLKFGAGTRLVMIPVFMISVAATTLLARFLKKTGKATLSPLLALMTLALAIFTVTGVTLRPLANQPGACAVAIIGAAGVVAMGIQNTLMRNALSNYSPTTIMTGNLTQCTIELVEMWLPATATNTIGRRLARGAAGKRLQKFGFPLLGFMVGAFAGAWLTHIWGLGSISVPTVTIGALAAAAWLGEARRAPVRNGIDRRLEQRPPPVYECRALAEHCSSPARGRWQGASPPLVDIARNVRREATARSGTYRQVRGKER